MDVLFFLQTYVIGKHSMYCTVRTFPAKSFYAPELEPDSVIFELESESEASKKLS